MERGALVCATNALLQFPYAPLLEYDLNVSLTGQSGNQVVSFSLVKNGHRFLLSLRSCENRFAGLSYINGQWALNNATRTEFSLENGRKYDLNVKVRKDSVQVLVDGKQLFEHKSDGTDFLAERDWCTPNESAIGIKTDRAMQFERIEVVDVSGKGQPLAVKRADDGGFFVQPCRPKPNARRPQPKRIVSIMETMSQ